MNSPLWSDSPDHDPDDDRYGRAGFERTLADRINLCEPGQKSVVFGLIGPWGSGKTRILGNIRKTLLAKEWSVVDFSPWSASDETGVTVEFLRALNEALGKQKSEQTKHLMKKMTSYLPNAISLGTTVATLTTGGLAGVGAPASKVVGQVLESIVAAPPWHKTFDQLSEAIGGEKKRVLMVVDDVDRLDVEELRALLRVLRLLGRFNNVHYLIAYDQASVEALIRGWAGDDGASKFMEKIVQHPFEVPPPPKHARMARLSETLQTLVAAATDHHGTWTAEDRIDDRIGMLADVISDEARTPRSIERFAQQLDSLTPLMLDAELDPIDFAAITWLRLCAHGLWEALPGLQEELVATLGTTDATREDAAVLDRWRMRVHELASEASGAHLVDVLTFLFSRIRQPGLRSYWLKHDHAASDEAYFNRYVVLGIAGDDVLDADLLAAIGAAVDGDDSALAALLEHPDKTIVAASAAKAKRYRADASSSSRVVLQLLIDAIAREFDVRASPALPHLRGWRVTEVVALLLSGSMTAPEIADMIGFWDAMNVFADVNNFSSDPESPLHSHVETLAREWIDRVRRDPDASITAPDLIFHLFDFARRVAHVELEPFEEVLDAAIVDEQSYLSALRCLTWFKHDEGAQMGSRRFHDELFEVVIAPGTHDRYAEFLRGWKPDQDRLVSERDDEHKSEYMLQAVVERVQQIRTGRPSHGTTSTFVRRGSQTS